jgi:hypothetical protein
VFESGYVSEFVKNVKTACNVVYDKSPEQSIDVYINNKTVQQETVDNYISSGIMKQSNRLVILIIGHREINVDHYLNNGTVT